MSKVFEDKACTQLLLQIILDRKDLKVLHAQTQYSIKNLQGRSVCLDIFTIDENRKVYNIEIQRDNRGAGPKRPRLIGSLLDGNVSDIDYAGEKLPEMYIIFITENDMFRYGSPIYHFHTTNDEHGFKLREDKQFIYVNSQIQDDTPLGKLMHDFYCTNPDDMYYKVLADRVRYFKEEKKGVKTMCKIMEELIEEKQAEQNIVTKSVVIKKLMKNLKLSLEEAMSALEISDEERRILSTRI